ncbi:MAG TPA: WG repeat-containing protein [Chryseosolibacter sp.]|nr:WG repeat-containing protein [Chryseosolibacter sp.]
MSETVRRLLFFLLFPVFFVHAGSNGKAIAVPGNEIRPFEENGKVGLKNDKGEVVIPATYEALGWSDRTFSLQENVTGYLMKGKWGLVNLDNEKVTEAEFIALSPGPAKFVRAVQKAEHSVYPKTGVIDTEGKIVIPFIYDGILVSGLRAIVFQRSSKGFKHGLIDFENRVVIPLQFRHIYPLGSLRYGVVSTENKTAIFSEDGMQLTDFVIDSIGSFKKDVAIFYQGAQRGVISREGKILFDALYRDVVFDQGKIKARKADIWMFLSGDNKTFGQLYADSVEALSLKTYRVQTNGRTKLFSKDLQPIGTKLYQSISDFKNNKAIFEMRDRKGLIRQDGSIAIPAKYKELIFDQHLVRASDVAQGRVRWMLFDSLGSAVTRKTYDFVGPFNGAFFPARQRNSWGAVDLGGNEIIACAHDSIIEARDDLVVVKFKGGYGIINTNESWLVTPQRHKLTILSSNRYLQITPDNIFLKSIKGDIIYFTSNKIEVRPDHILEFLSSGKIWRINFDGIVTEQSAFDRGFEKIYPESEGLRPIKKDGRYGFVDARLRLRIANRYEEVQGFQEGLAAVKILGKWGFINLQDNIAVQPSYDQVFPFENGCALVRRDEAFGVIDKKGQTILPVRYDRITKLSGNRYLMEQDGLWGVADATGKILLNPKFTSIQDVDNGYMIVAQQGKYGVVTVEGISTIPLMYDAISYDRFHHQFLAVKKSEWEEFIF